MRRAVEQTLPDLVRWSYELLDDDERLVLRRAAVFAGGFDLATYCGVYAADDDVALLRALDRLVRRSLVVADHAHGRVRYRLLETIRQFGTDELVVAGTLETCRDHHARFFAREATAQWQRWNGPGWHAAVHWVEGELADLRSAYRWSATRDVEVASDIAAHAALIGTSGQWFEPIGWVENLLPAAVAADVPRLPRLFTAAGYACFVGRPAEAADHAHRATELEGRPGYDPCEPGLALFVEALANVYSGNLPKYVELTAKAAELPGTRAGVRATGVRRRTASDGTDRRGNRPGRRGGGGRSRSGEPVLDRLHAVDRGADAVEHRRLASTVGMGRGRRVRAGAGRRILRGLPRSATPPGSTPPKASSGRRYACSRRRSTPSAELATWPSS